MGGPAQTTENPVDNNSDVDVHPTKISARSIVVVLVATLATAAYSFTWNSVTVALPHMKGAFSATTDQISWVLIAYIVGSAISTATVSWFTNRYGRRQVFLFVIAGFTLTQFGCGFSSTLESEVIWRFIQGTMGAPLIPLGQVIAVNAFPKERYTQATSLWALGFITANVISPALAGYLVDAFGWPWVFFVTVPVSTVCFLAAIVLIPRTPHTAQPMDWTGFTTLILGIGCLQLMISRGERLGWFDSTEVVVELIGTGIFLYIFVVHTVLAKRPFIDRSLFLNRDYMIGLTSVFMVGLVMFVPLVLTPLQLQQLGGFPASEIGYLMMSRGLGTVISLATVSLWADRVDPRALMIFGVVVTAAGIWSMSRWTADIQPEQVIFAQFMMGIAVGSVWSPMSKMALSNVSKKLQDQAFAIFYLAFDIGNAIGTALIIVLFTQHSQIGHAIFAEHISPYNRMLNGNGANDGGWNISSIEGLGAIDNEITRQSMAVAFNNSYLIISIILLGIVPLVLLFRRQHYGRTLQDTD